MKKKLWIAAGLMSLALSVNVAAAYDQGVIKQVQQALNDAGFDCGTPDGLAGEKTKAAVSAYQTQQGMDVTGEISDALLEALGLSVEAAETTDTSAAEVIETQTTADTGSPHSGDLPVPDEVMNLISAMAIVPPQEEADIPMEPTPNDIGEKVSEFYVNYTDGEASSEITTFFQYDDKGRLLSETETTHILDEEWDWPDMIVGTVYTYDENDNLIMKATYGCAGEVNKLESYRSSSYDSENNLISEIYCEDTGEITNYVIFLLDDKGNKVKQYRGYKAYNSASGESTPTINTREIETDANGNILRKTLTESTDPDEEIGSYVEYTYDEDNRLLSEISYDSKNNVLTKEEYTYTADGYSTRYEDSEDNSYSITAYDNNDNELSYKHYKAGDDTPYYTSEWTYDEAGNLLEELVTKEGQQYPERTLEYDELGRLVKETNRKDSADNIYYTREFTY